MNKKTLKRIYKLRHEVKNANDIKKELKKRYNIYIPRSKVEEIISNMPLSNKYPKYLNNLILKMYRDFYDTEKAIEYLNLKYNLSLTKSAVYSRAHESNIKKTETRRYNKSLILREDEKEITNLYLSGKTSREIASIYGYKTKKSIIDKLERNNIKRRNSSELMKDKRTYKEFSLEIIDSKEKAYIIGLLMTDGYVSLERGYIGLDLIDKDCIDFISNYIKVKPQVILSKNKNHKTKYRINVCGKEYLKQVERYGIVALKTFNIKGCTLKDDEIKYMPYIMRGVIDGDGWIRKDGKEFFISSASEEFISWCKSSLESLEFSSLKYSFKKNESNGIYILRSALTENIELLKKIIYKEPFGMSRKYSRLHKNDVQRL